MPDVTLFVDDDGDVTVLCTGGGSPLLSLSLLSLSLLSLLLSLLSLCSMSMMMVTHQCDVQEVL